jgi:hypothetical protein
MGGSYLRPSRPRDIQPNPEHVRAGGDEQAAAVGAAEGDVRGANLRMRRIMSTARRPSGLVPFVSFVPFVVYYVKRFSYYG